MTCPRCDGSGQLQAVSRTPFGQVVRTAVCDTCGGDGRIAEQPCSTCRGAGAVQSERTLQVDVPAGIADGQRIRITGRGHAGERGGPPGDLYVLVRVLADERFLRDGDDLVTVIDVPAPRAALGTTVQVPTLDGDVPLDIPAGTQPGETHDAARPRAAAAAARAHRRPARRGQRGDAAAALARAARPARAAGRHDDRGEPALRRGHAGQAQAGARRVTMLRLGVRVRPEAAELALAALLELSPQGLEERDGPGAVEYALYGAPDALPGAEELRARLGDALLGVDQRELPADWERRWHAHLEPVDLQGRAARLRVRAPWHPRHPDPAVLDVAVEPGAAFGAGAHATTRLCLELLLDAGPPPADAGLCDWGAGTGVLALAAARTGVRPGHGRRARPRGAGRAARQRGARTPRSPCSRPTSRPHPPPWAATVTANLPRALLERAAARDRRRRHKP